MILTFARPSVGARVGSGNVVAFGFASQGQAPIPAVVGTGFQNPITTAVHPRLLRFGFAPVGTLGQAVTRRAVGSVGGGRRRITRAELERELKQQRDNTFGRRWFDEFQAAEQAAREAALQAPKKAARKALDRAADAAAQVADELNVTAAQVDLRPLTAALEALSGAKKLSETIAASKGAIEWANRIIAELKRAADEDEDAAMTLLMLQ